VLAEFASAVEALRAAVEFQQAIADANRDESELDRMVFRVGIHLGDLIVEGDDLYGYGVNIAARLEAVAAQLLQPQQRAALVAAHKPRIPHDVRRRNGR
jgi:class 3 adenylate cyclase